MRQERVGPAYKLWVAVERYRRGQLLTWQELAARVGVGRQTLHNLRDGKEAPRLKTVHRIADAIGLDRTEAERLAGHQPIDSYGDLDARDARTPERREESAEQPRSGVEARRADARDAIMHDDRLDATGRAMLLAAFDAVVARVDGQRPAPRPVTPPFEQEAEDTRDRRAG